MSDLFNNRCTLDITPLLSFEDSLDLSLFCMTFFRNPLANYLFGDPVIADNEMSLCIFAETKLLTYGKSPISAQWVEEDPNVYIFFRYHLKSLLSTY